MQSIRASFPFIVIALFWQACANPVSPTGGPKDTSPPELDTLLSAPDRQTMFKDREFRLVFNEWIQLDNVQDQMVVSPPLAKRPEVKALGKTLVFRFHEEEVLRDSTTYTVNFGKAVKDQNEGNKISGLRFIFSTGPVIDSLKFRGSVVDAFTGEPVAELPVLLYRNGPDSVITKEKPYYFSVTDPQGRFSLENLRTGLYRLVALQEKNPNLQFDQPGESIAFVPEAVKVSDTLVPGPELRLSTPAAYTAFSEVNVRDSISLSVGFPSPPSLPVICLRPYHEDMYTSLVKDSFQIWIAPGQSFPDTIILSQGDEIKDTIRIKSRGPGLRPLRMVSSSLAQGAISPQQGFFVEFDQPLRIPDTALIRLLDTADRSTPYTLTRDSMDLKKLILHSSFREGQAYRLQFLPGSLVRWNGEGQEDTLKLQIQVGKRANFGRLTLKITGLDPEFPYWLEVIFKESRTVYSQALPVGIDSTGIDLEGLPPGNYSLRVITDLNQNRRWDPADYWAKKQPEPVFTVPLGELRANWELSLDIPVPGPN